ncbi:hypothetical protein KJ966_30750 [bacterium]|nr:hypothetical protein [bacterium]
MIDLKPEDFEVREWLALKYAQDWVFFNEQEQESAHQVEYRQTYSDLEQKCIWKLLKMMQFANQFNNTFFRKQWRPDLEDDAPSCRMPLRHDMGVKN